MRSQDIVPGQMFRYSNKRDVSRLLVVTNVEPLTKHAKALVAMCDVFVCGKKTDEVFMLASELTSKKYLIVKPEDTPPCPV